mgnify:CR=1 FL=1
MKKPIYLNFKRIELVGEQLRQSFSSESPQRGPLSYDNATFARYVCREDVRRILRKSEPRFGHIICYFRFTGTRSTKLNYVRGLKGTTLVIGCTRFSPSAVIKIRAWARKRGTNSENHN